MMKKDKAIPKFKNEDEEREFWATHSPQPKAIVKINLNPFN